MLLPAVTPPLCVAPDGPLTGPFTSRWPEGPLAVEGMCQTGQPEGDWSWWDEHGDVISRGHFLHGRPTGEWTQLYQGKRLGSFTMADGTGVAVSWWPSGAKRLEVGFVNGVADGDVASWRADGTRELEGHIAKGRGHGYFTSYDAKGRVTSKVALPNGYTPP
jgi:antitoxin component YwqK of YwqJK toxin-antitoxin module